MRTLLLSLVSLAPLSIAVPSPQQLDVRQVVLDAYAPVPTSCPKSALIRPANGISSDEAKYYSSRKPKADAGLAAWLTKRGTFATDTLPSVAFTSSGGGYRSLLETAGVFQALDLRDSNYRTSGVFQGLTYEAGLSGRLTISSDRR